MLRGKTPRLERFFIGALFNLITFAVVCIAIIVSIYGIRQSNQASGRANRLAETGNAIAASGGIPKPEILDGRVNADVSVYACKESIDAQSRLMLRHLGGGRLLLVNNGGKPVSVIDVLFLIDDEEFGEVTVLQPHGPQTIVQPIPIPIPMTLGVGEGRWVEIVSRLRRAVTGPDDLDTARRLQGPAKFEIRLTLSDGSTLSRSVSDGYYSKGALDYTISSPSACD